MKLPWLMLGLPRRHSGEESTCQCRTYKRHGFDPWVGKIPWRRKWQPTPVVLPGESHGWRSLAGYSLWVGKESDRTEHSHTHTHWLMFAKLWIPSIDSEAQVRVLTPGSHVRSKSVPGDTGLTFYS